MSAWTGAWRASVAGVAVPTDDPTLSALAATLGVTPVDALLPVAAGELRVLVCPFDRIPDPRNLPRGELVIVLTGAADARAAEDAVVRLAREVAGVVDAVGESSRWVERAEATRYPRAAGIAAAQRLASAYALTTVDVVPDDRDTPDILRVALDGPRADDLRHTDPRIRAEAARRDTGAARALVDDSDPAVRIAAAARLASEQAPDDIQRAMLDRLARDAEPLVRARAAQAGDSTTRLERLLDDPSSVVRVVAAHTLAERGAQAPLRRAATHSDNYVRWKAAWALRDTATLAGLLHDPDCDVRREAARSLGRARGDAAARLALEAALRDPNSFVRRWAAEALGELGDPAARTALEPASRDTTALVAAAARAALARLQGSRPTARPAPPDLPHDDASLRAMLASPDATIRKDAAKFAAAREDATTLLLPLLDDPDGEVRKSAVEAIGRHMAGGKAPGAVGTALARRLDDEDPDTRITTLDALRASGGVPIHARARVATLARSSDTETRLRAFQALTADPDVPAALFAAGATDPDERIRAAVAARTGQHADDERSVLVRRAARRTDDPARSVLEAHDAWATGFLAREDDLLHLVFSWNRAEDRPASHRALRPPVLRPYGHPDRG
jgi:HEAT repeat protein